MAGDIIITLGPTFFMEAADAELIGLDFNWGPTRVTFGPSIRADDRARVEAVVKAHNPGRPLPTPPPSATVAQLLECLTDVEQATVQAVIDRGTPAMRAWWASHYADPVPISAPKIGKVAPRAGLDVASWYVRALARALPS